MSQLNPFQILFPNKNEHVLTREEEKIKVLFLYIGQQAINACLNKKDIYFIIKVKENEIKLTYGYINNINKKNIIIENMQDYRNFIDILKKEEKISLSYLPNFFSIKELEEAYDNSCNINSYKFLIYRNQQKEGEIMNESEEIISQELSYNDKTVKTKTKKKIRKKKRYFFICFILCLFMMITLTSIRIIAKSINKFSMYSSSQNMKFFTELSLDEKSFDLRNLKDDKVIELEISNYHDKEKSEVKCSYNIILTSSNNIPLFITISSNNETKSYLFNGNSNQERIILSSNIFDTTSESHFYTITFSFPHELKNELFHYVDEIDYLSLSIESTQIQSESN